MSAKKKAPAKKKKEVKKPEPEDVAAPEPEPAPKPEEAEPTPSQLLAAEIAGYEETLGQDVAKLVEKDADGEALAGAQERHKAIKLLKEVQTFVERGLEMIEELKALEEKVSTESAGMHAAKEYIDNKSADYRTEHDAFVALHELDDGQFQRLLGLARDPAWIEKAEAAIKAAEAPPEPEPEPEKEPEPEPEPAPKPEDKEDKEE